MKSLIKRIITQSGIAPCRTAWFNKNGEVQETADPLYTTLNGVEGVPLYTEFQMYEIAEKVARQCTGKVLTETQEGITMPADYSFDAVNDYVHGMEVHFEELQALCLGMADHIDKLRSGEFICRRCGLRKNSERSTEHEF